MCADIVTNAPCCGERRVLLFNGSPHKDGPVARMLRAFREALPPAWPVEEIDCYARPAHPCTGCGGCEKREGCVFADLDAEFAALEQADVLVFATPVHNLSFSAPLKIRIDRTQRYWAARFVHGKRPPVARPKQAVLLTAAGAPGRSGHEMVEKQLLPPLTILNSRLVSSVAYSGADAGEPLGPVLDEVRQAALMLTTL